MMALIRLKREHEPRRSDRGRDRAGRGRGPLCGRYPAGSTQRWKTSAGPTHRRVRRESKDSLARTFPPRWNTPICLFFIPRDASPAALRSLLDAGWSTTDIVTLSQLVAFLSFQILRGHGARARLQHARKQQFLEREQSR